MRLIDDSPAGFLAICFVVVYGVIGVEAAMWIAPSIVFVALTFLLIAVIAGAICAWMIRVLSDDDAPATVDVALSTEPTVVPAAVASPQPRQEARPVRALIPV